MTKLIDVHDSDQEREIRRHKTRFGKQTSLAIPDPLIEKKRTTHETKKQDKLGDEMFGKDKKLSYKNELVMKMSTSERVTQKDEILQLEKTEKILEYKKKKSIAKAKKYLRTHTKALEEDNDLQDLFDLSHLSD